MPITSEQAKLNGKLGGRPTGYLAKETILKNKALRQINLRVAKMADKLINAQSIVALGTHKMIIRTTVGGIPSIETVRDEKRMQDLLDNGVYGQDYLILEGSKPDWKAANAMLDRAFGKAKESIAFSGEVQFSLKGLADRRRIADTEKTIDVPLIETTNLSQDENEDADD